MKTVSITQFKSKLEDYAEKIQNGAEFIITEGRAKKKIFKVSPFTEGKSRKRTIGPLDGKAKAIFSKDWTMTDQELTTL